MTEAGTEPSEPTPENGEKRGLRQKLARFRRFAPLLLLAGGLGATLVVAPKLPHDREIELRITDPASVVQVDLQWLSPSDAEEVIQGGSWRFSRGSAPRSIVSKVSLPDGRYDLDVLVRRTDGADASHRRSLTLGDGQDESARNRVTVRLP
jgi:hypothetical protein